MIGALLTNLRHMTYVQARILIGIQGLQLP